ncbi:MAG TPA: Gfo/Idh/MocA family oxidoreductase [Acidimicrobiales bacterium]
MRVAVVGCGYWGSKHVRVLADSNDVDQLYLVDSEELRCKGLQRAFPRAEVQPDLERALAEVDAAVIATPAHTHARLAMRCIEAGVHVLVEKPLATSVADAVRLVEASRAAGVVLMVGHTFEYNPAVWALRDVIDSGEIGRVYYIDSARLNLGHYQPDVDVMWDLAPHDISIVNYLLRAKPAVVRAWGASHAHSHLHDVAYIRLEFREPEVVTAQVHVSWLDPCKVRRTTVVGSRKMAVYNDLAADERLRIYDKGLSYDGDGDPNLVRVTQGAGSDPLHSYPVTYRNGGITSPFIVFKEPLKIEDEHFVECVKSGRTPNTDGLSGLAVVEVLEAASRSIAEERPVHLSESLVRV